MENKIITVIAAIMILLSFSCTKSVPKNKPAPRPYEPAKVITEKEYWEQARQSYVENDTADPLIYPRSVNKYKPVADHYKNLSVKDFSNDWKYFCVFSKDNVNKKFFLPYDLEDLSTNYSIDFSIIRDSYQIICGLYETYEGETKAFIAKISKDETKVLQVKQMPEKSDMIMFIIDKGESFWIGYRFGSEADYYVFYDDITQLNKFVLSE